MTSSLEDVELVRLRIADVHDDESKRLLTDQQLTLLLGEHQGSTWRASAEALRIIATSEVLVSKAISTQDLSTDGAKVSDALRRLAADYEAKADEQDAAEHGALHIVPFGGAGRAEGEEHRWDGGRW